MDGRAYIERAIELSKESVKQGRFPAGALIVKEGKILAEGVSAIYPSYSHAEKTVIDKASTLGANQLNDAILYCSLEPCLMCLTTAHHAGIKEIVYACDKDKVSPEYYEAFYDDEKRKIAKHLMNAGHFNELEEEALEVVESWEKNNS